MMTAWVVLHRLPLAVGESGPCETVNGADLALYNADVANDLSSVKIATGITLCEDVLLRGMLVHSAADYAQLLVSLAGMHEPTFVAAMNQYARVLGLHHTSYTDVTGISDGDLSTAQDQATLAVDLMTDEPVVQGIVDLPEVSLPIAGVVESFTPFVGQGNVVGVKSGYTKAAGGCDVMAVNVNFVSTVITTYAVVLGEHGGDAVGTAGIDALNLSRSVRASIARVRTTSGVEVEWIGSTADVVAASPTP
jgi:D-alanyl-D-alanine carboxypeptidase (penicillin-binding protein 5/6)